LADASVVEPGTELFGYRVLEFVGEGGWAYVYKAQHPKLPKFVAIKQLKPEWVEDEHALQRFLREANIVARINHPNVVTIYDLRQDDHSGPHYIITEFAEKGTLADRLRDSPNGLPMDEVLHIAMGICSGLEAVHRRGLVHRDIKPTNILMVDVGESRDIPKLSDFGIAEPPTNADLDAGLEVPESSGVYGTIPYMSPEQLDTKVEVDHRSDLYSLGVVLYELLTGQVPFTGEVHDVFWAHMCVAPRPPRELRPDVPESLAQVVLRALAKRCEERYACAADMHEALRAIESIKVRRDRQRRFEKLLKMGHRHLEKGEWDAAAEVLGQAHVLEPENDRVLDGLRRAHEQQELQRLYERGARFLEEEDWEAAQDSLAQVMSFDPEYADGQARALLDQATQALDRRRRRRALMVRYRTGIGHFRQARWARAIAELEQVVGQDPEFEDAADRLKDARRYLDAEQLLERARRHEERGEWETVVDLLEEVRLLEPPHIDVNGELEEARRKWVAARREQEVAAWYDAGVAHLESGHLEGARADFGRIHERWPGYRDVADRLRDIDKRSSQQGLFERASGCEDVCDWEGAIKAYRGILDIDPYNHEATRRLARVQRCADRGGRGGLVGVGLRAESWWSKRCRGAKVALVASLGIVLVGLCGGAALAGSKWVTAASSANSVALCNGDFESKFRCWQHGGELDQSVQCDGQNCTVVLGSPDYVCSGGVPVGKAWIKQTVEVPDESGPTLSLRYRVFSYDLDLPEYDYFQVVVNGEPLSERYGNSEWIEPSCDREPWDSGWQTLTLDLSAYRGQEIELSFRNVNGSQPYPAVKITFSSHKGTQRSLYVAMPRIHD